MKHTFLSIISIVNLVALGGGAGCVKRSASSGLQSGEGVMEGVATHFDGLGVPYGGCGVPEGILETPYFVALNVQNTPGDYVTRFDRPFHNPDKMGAFDNGRNCGRWVHVTIGDFCKGQNSGEKGSGLCGGGSWQQDDFNGAQLDLLVTDSCQDDNVWCRDSKYHLDLSTASIEKFKPGLAQKWNNRKISWQYVEAPSYQGDIRIGFRKDAQPGWPAFIITHLKNGLHGVEQLVDGRFQPLKMDSDLGQSYILNASGSGPYRIRLVDAADQLVQGGRVYEFNFPASCGGKCGNAFNEVTYTTSDGSGTPPPVTPTPTPTPTPGQGASGTYLVCDGNPFCKDGFGWLENGQSGCSSATFGWKDHGCSCSCTAGSGQAGLLPQTQTGAKAEIRVKSEWQGGYCADLVVRNASGQAISGWSVQLLSAGATLTQQWNVKVTRTTAGYLLEPSAVWNGAIAPGAENNAQGFCTDASPASNKISVGEVVVR